MIHKFEDLDKWSQRFLKEAELVASWSKDPRRKVGCVIVNDDHIQLAGGYNGFPRNVIDSQERLNNKAVKLKCTVHAENNAIAAAANIGHALKNSTAYITSHPCSPCAAVLIQAGIRRVVFYTVIDQPEWEEDHKLAKEMFSENGTQYLEVTE